MNRYTPRDPRFEGTCTSCRFGGHRCAGTIDVDAGTLVGTYRCACTKCRAS